MDDGLNVRWYMDPIFRGQYPADILEHLGANAPKVETGDLDLIHQPLDFLGINFYTRSFISTQTPPKPAPGKQGFTDMGWEIYPDALTQHLVRLSREYAPPPIFITENGMANADKLVDGRVADVERICRFQFAFARDVIASGRFQPNSSEALDSTAKPCA